MVFKICVKAVFFSFKPATFMDEGRFPYAVLLINDTGNILDDYIYAWAARPTRPKTTGN